MKNIFVHYWYILSNRWHSRLLFIRISYFEFIRYWWPRYNQSHFHSTHKNDMWLTFAILFIFTTNINCIMKLFQTYVIWHVRNNYTEGRWNCIGRQSHSFFNRYKIHTINHDNEICFVSFYVKYNNRFWKPSFM